MEIITLDSTESLFKGKINVDKDYLVLPVQSIIITIIIPLVLTLLVYGLFIIFPDESIFSIIRSIYTIEFSLLLGVVLTIVVSFLWFFYWKKNFSKNNIVNIRIDKMDQIIEVSRDVGSRYNIDTYKIHLDFLINIIIGRSADGKADGWSLNLFIRNQKPNEKPITHSIFILNDKGLKDLYRIGLEIKESLQKMDLQAILRISDLFLRKVKDIEI